MEIPLSKGHDPECCGWVGRIAAAARSDGYELTAYNLGIRRDTSSDIRKRWEAECAARLNAACQKYVLFSFGANDIVEEEGSLRVDMEESVNNFSYILGIARRQFSILVVGPLPVGDPMHSQRVLSLCEQYKYAVTERQVAYLPVASRLIDNSLWLRETAAHDGSHPGSAGYELLASIVAGWPEWWFRTSI